MKPSFMKPNDHKIGVGATEELSLRVSVAALVSVLFDDPEDGRTMLALERTATLREIEGRPEVTVRAKPFGGAVRLTNPQALKGLIGHFHYDSKRSRQERDFRIQIHPASWEKVKKICQEHLKKMEKGILDSSPERELAEEFEDTLDVRITPDQYHLKPRGIIVEDLPCETDNVRAEGFPTVRIYYVFEAWMEAPDIIMMILANNRRYFDKDLQKMAWKDFRQGGRGRANAILALGLDDLKDVYRSIPTDRRGGPIRVGGHQLDGNVLAILKDVDQPKYQRYIRQSY
jgi:hypothetical protein